jgi:hypothetical protein
MEAKATSQPKAELKLRIKRAGSNEWEDGPDANSVAHLPIKARFYLALHNVFARLQSKLEEMQK